MLPKPIIIVFSMVFAFVILALLFLIFEIHSLKNQKGQIPTCDSNVITDMVIEQFKTTPLFYNNKYNTFIYARVINPTATMFDKDIPRYECRAQIDYKYHSTFWKEQDWTGIADVSYSVSNSLGKPVVYANYRY